MCRYERQNISEIKVGFLPTPQDLVLRNFKLNHSQAHQEDITYNY
jgi:hypothetical protein